ncbi:MAG TPA: hypothetical protein VF949_10140 [Reyranella sp.]
MTAAILNVRSAAAPGTVSLKDTKDLVRLFALDRLPVDRPRLVCHWHRDADGRLACTWGPDNERPARRFLAATSTSSTAMGSAFPGWPESCSLRRPQ